MQASSQPALLDLLALGPVRELILKHLSSGGKKAMMQACKAMRREVQLHSQHLTLTLPRNAETQHELALELSRTLLRPKRLTIEAAEKPCTTDVGEALPITELAATFSGVKEVEAHLPCSHHLAVACALNMRRLTTLQLEMVPAATDGWLLVGHLSSLTQLTVLWRAGHVKAPPSMWRALQQCQALRTLRLWWKSEKEAFSTHQSLNLQPVSTLTQLRSLDFRWLIDSSFNIAGLTTLTALTSLRMWWSKLQLATADGVGTAGQQQQQVQLGEREHTRQQGQGLQLATTHLRHLKDLTLYRISVPAGIAEPLAQLTGLTRLCMHKTEPDESWYSSACHNPVMLPSVEQLSLCGRGTLQFLAGTHLPLLANLKLEIKLSADTAATQAQLLRSRMASLQHCPDFSLKGLGKEVTFHELGPMLATLASVWQQPPPSEGDRQLILTKLNCTQSALSHLPAGLTSLGIRKCRLDADSLQPVAQLRHLNNLWFYACDGLTTSCLESFLRAAVQGSGLHIMTVGLPTEEEKRQRRAMYESLIQSKGAQNVPTWHT